jgi:uncharacterized DUF497 family protein
LSGTQKAASNRKKHGVTFEEASTALRDPLSLTGADPEHSIEEARWITFGVSDPGRLLVVAHTEEGEVVRIINARPATTGERRIYEEAWFPWQE